MWHSKTTSYLYFYENWILQTLFLQTDNDWNKNFKVLIFANAMFKQKLPKFVIKIIIIVARILSYFRLNLELKAPLWIGVSIVW